MHHDLPNNVETHRLGWGCDSSAAAMKLGRACKLAGCLLGLLVSVAPLHAAPVFTEHPVVVNNNDPATSVTSADVDGDGKIDLLSISERNTIAWHENDGVGNFTTHLVWPDEDNEPAMGNSSLASADLNGDGHIDLVSYRDGVIYDDGAFGWQEIAWYESDGEGSFTKKEISIEFGEPGRYLERPPGLFTVDVDGDGDIDLIMNLGSVAKILWYENDGDGNFSQRVVNDYAPDGSGNFPAPVVNADVADVNGDGNIDVFSLSSVDLSWYQNNGAGVFTRHVISSGLDLDALVGRPHITSADVNGDGDMDILAVSGASILWYQGDGAGNFTSHVDRLDPFTDALSVTSTDVDGDGIVDLIRGGYDSISWLKGDGLGNFTPHVVSNNVGYAVSVASADIDGDGDIDPIAVSRNEGKIAWYENEGSSGVKDLTVAAGQWVQIGLPCTPAVGEDTLAGLIGDDLSGVLGTDWVVYEYSLANNDGKGGYAALTPGSQMKAGKAYWLVHYNDNNTPAVIDLPESCATPQLTNPAGCASANGCYEIPLETSASIAGWNMIGHPFTHSIRWNRLRILDDNRCSNGCRLTLAKLKGVFYNRGWRYDPTANNGQGGYQELQGSAMLEAWTGFWGKTLNNAVNPRLLLPVD